MYRLIRIKKFRSNFELFLSDNDGEITIKSFVFDGWDGNYTREEARDLYPISELYPEDQDMVLDALEQTTNAAFFVSEGI